MLRHYFFFPLWVISRNVKISWYKLYPLWLKLWVIIVKIIKMVKFRCIESPKLPLNTEKVTEIPDEMTEIISVYVRLYVSESHTKFHKDWNWIYRKTIYALPDILITEITAKYRNYWKCHRITDEMTEITSVYVRLCVSESHTKFHKEISYGKNPIVWVTPFSNILELQSLSIPLSTSYGFARIL
jgi:hypothetical protein